MDSSLHTPRSPFFHGIASSFWRDYLIVHEVSSDESPNIGEAGNLGRVESYIVRDSHNF